MKHLLSIEDLTREDIERLCQANGVLPLGEAQATERGAHHCAHALAILGGEVDARVLDRLHRAGDREGAEALQPRRRGAMPD